LLKRKLPFITESCYDLLNRMLCYDPGRRISAQDALQHPYFTYVFLLLHIVSVALCVAQHCSL
jgi:serine/threonine protein kinase